MIRLDWVTEHNTIWQNFLDAIDDEDSYIVPDKILHNALSEYNGKIVNEPGRYDEIVFETEADFIYFMMRWA